MANQTKHTKATTEKLVDVYDVGGDDNGGNAHAHTDRASAAIAMWRTYSEYRERNSRRAFTNHDEADEFLCRDCSD